MGLFKWLFKRKFAPNQAVLTDEMRAKGLEQRRLQHDINQLSKEIQMKKQLERLENSLNSGKKGDFEEMMMMMLMSKLFGVNAPMQQSNVYTPAQQNLNNSNTIDLTDEQILTYLEDNKQYLKYAKSLTDEQIYSFIKGKAPQLTDKSVLRAIEMIKTYEK